MKKIVLVLLLSILIVFSLSAKDATSDFNIEYKKWKSGSNFNGLTREMKIAGNVYPSGNITITVFDSENHNGEKGIPFDIVGGDVSAPAGRQIGEFSLFSNSPHVKLTVKATPLRSGREILNYELLFSYRFESYGDDGKPVDKMKAGTFSVLSDEVSKENEINADSDHQKIDISGANGSINIHIEDSAAKAAAPGFYESTVTVSMEVIE